MKILRISQTYPTKENNGKGLHAYNYSNNIDFPTVVLTKFYNESYLEFIHIHFNYKLFFNQLFDSLLNYDNFFRIFAI